MANLDENLTTDLQLQATIAVQLICHTEFLVLSLGPTFCNQGFSDY